VAINLLRLYGRYDAVFFYNKEIEVDFYIPETCTAIQGCLVQKTNKTGYAGGIREKIFAKMLLDVKKRVTFAA